MRYTLHGSATGKIASKELIGLSYAVVRMVKLKSHDLKGIQFHNQRERESKTNPDIDSSNTENNYDLVNESNIDYNKRVKEIIESQKEGTRKTRKDAVLVNEFIVTSDASFFDKLSPADERTFFEESLSFFAERYGKQNIAFSMVHKDEKTPHMHVGVVPMRDGRLQGKNIFNRQELLWLQEEFPKHMQQQGFELQRGEKGSGREHIETAKFKKQALEKENDVLEKEIANKKNELLALNETVPDEIKIQAKRQMKTVEVPTGEKTIFGREKVKKEKQPTGNRIMTEEEFQKMKTVLKENQGLKAMLESYLKTDIVKENKQLKRQNEFLKGVIDEYYDDWQDLAKENRMLENENSELKAHIGDLTYEIKNLYEVTTNFLKARTPDLGAFKTHFKAFIEKLKENVPRGVFNRLYEGDNEINLKNIQKQHEQIRKSTPSVSKSRGMEL